MLESIFLVKFKFDDLEECLKSMDNPSEQPEIPGSHGTITHFYPQISISLNNSGAIGRIILQHLNKIRTSQNSTYPFFESKITSSLERHSGKNLREDDAEERLYAKLSGSYLSGNSPIEDNPIRLISTIDTEILSDHALHYPQKPKSSQIDLHPQNIYDSLVYSCFLPSDKILCLVFSKNDNPYDYTKDIEDAIDVFIYSNLEEFHILPDNEIETALMSVYIDIRSRSLILTEDCSFFIGQDELRERLISDSINKIIKVFLYGIDNVGKSSFMRYLKTNKFDLDYFSPTKKFIVHRIPLPQGYKIICWEMPGQKKFRRVWLRGVQESNILLFMLDASDEERFLEAKRAFWSIVTRYEVKNVPVLFIANKIDLIDNKTKLSKIEPFFSLPELQDRKWSIKFTSLVTKEGIKDVIDWITETVKENLLEDIKKVI
ncbi:MAG: GTP-binding protein [Candidatus Lokiarchaeota archaeon]|nr:GTP-binding protein [Candidatus Lokiarchaeota archaeon]